MATDFGSDISAVPDLDPSGAIQSGTGVLAEAILRRLITQRGTLVDSLNYGTDVRSWLSDMASSGITINQAKTAIERECRQDERVFTADAQVWFDQPSQSLGISLTLSTANGPFKLVLGVTSLTIQILQTG